MRDKTRFWRNVKHRLLAFKKGGSLLEVQPDKPVPFQRQAMGTQSVGAWINSAIRQELPEAFLANRTSYPIANEKKSGHLQTRPADPLKIFSGNIPDQERDKSFHEGQR